jgi:uncharacterized protein
MQAHPEGEVVRPVVDADVHNGVPPFEALRPYLPEQVVDFCTFTGYRGPDDTDLPMGTASPLPARWPQDGPSRTQAELLDGQHVQAAILNCGYLAGGVMNPYLSAAFASAVNEWQAREWLDVDPRLRASIVLPGDVELAVEEIERRASDRRFVQALLPVRALEPFGKRHNHALWRAAAEHGLVVALCFGGSGAAVPTSVGWPSRYVEEYVAMAGACQSQIMSVISEGVLDRFPATRIVCVGCGWAWAPALAWRMDKEWKGLRHEIPWVRRPPSEYLREHIRFTLTPVELPEAAEIERAFAHLGSDELLLYSSGYPYPQPSARQPREVLADLPGRLRHKLEVENAVSLYESERLGLELAGATPDLSHKGTT